MLAKNADQEKRAKGLVSGHLAEGLEAKVTQLFGDGTDDSNNDIFA